VQLRPFLCEPRRHGLQPTVSRRDPAHPRIGAGGSVKRVWQTDAKQRPSGRRTYLFAEVEQERTMKLKLTALAGVLAVLAASLASASANAAPCGPGYKKVGNYCITKAYNPNLKLKAR
jgi:hypothetical protein